MLTHRDVILVRARNAALHTDSCGSLTCRGDLCKYDVTDAENRVLRSEKPTRRHHFRTPTPYPVASGASQREGSGCGPCMSGPAKARPFS